MQMQYWVYISEKESNGMTIGFSENIGALLGSLPVQQAYVVYLRPFDVAFDALAHKHLLDSLSKATCRNIIRQNREQTKRYQGLLSARTGG